MRSRWVWALARLQAAMVFLQAVFAGGFLSGRAGLLKAHAVNASLLWLLSIAMFVVCIAAWRGGRSPGWVAAAAGAIWAALEVQIASGESGQLWIHVPLGMVVFGTAVAIVIGTRIKRRSMEPPPTMVGGRSAGPPQLLPPPTPEPW
jgi:ABC-type xylose transport system permease subunit